MAHKRHNVFHLASECDSEWIKNRLDFIKSQEGENIIFDNIFVLDLETYFRMYSSKSGSKFNESKYIERVRESSRIRYYNFSGINISLNPEYYNYINHGEFGMLVISGNYSKGIGDKKLAITTVVSKFGELFDIKNHGYYTILHPNASYVYQYSKEKRFLELSTYSRVISENTPNTYPITILQDELFVIYNNSLVKNILKREIEYSPELSHFGSDLDFLIRSKSLFNLLSEYHVDNSRDIITKSLSTCGFITENKAYHPGIGKYIQNGFRKLKSQGNFKELENLGEMAYDTLTNLKGEHMDALPDSKDSGRIEIMGKIFVFTPCYLSHPGSINPLRQSSPFRIYDYFEMIYNLVNDDRIVYEVINADADVILGNSQEYPSQVSPLPYSLKIGEFTFFNFHGIEKSSIFEQYFISSNEINYHPDMFASKNDMYYFLTFWYYTFLYNISKRKKIPITNISHDYQGLLHNSLLSEKKMLTFLSTNGMIF